MNRRLVFGGVLLLLVAVVGVVWVRAAPTIGAITVNPPVVGVNVPTHVTVAVHISDPTLIPTSVNLLRVDSTGRTLANLGVLYDDGTNGDAAANDKVFSKIISFHEADPGVVRIQVSAAFRGMVRRSIVNGPPLEVWQKTSTDDLGEVFFPPTLFARAGDHGQLLIASTPHELALGAAPEDGRPFAISGFQILLTHSTLSAPFDIDAWLRTEYPRSEVASLTTETLRGAVIYRVTFAHEVGAGKPVVILPQAQSVLTATFSSSFPSGTEAENNALADFEAILKRLASR